jgi:hypothetical protein
MDAHSCICDVTVLTCQVLHYGHKPYAAVNPEALSSACQIVIERLMMCVQPAQKDHAFQATFFLNHHWSRIMQPPYNVYKI